MVIESATNPTREWTQLSHAPDRSFRQYERLRAEFVKKVSTLYRARSRVRVAVSGVSNCILSRHARIQPTQFRTSRQTREKNRHRAGELISTRGATSEPQSQQTRPGGSRMLEPEQILHALIILSVEAEKGINRSGINLAAEHLGCDSDDIAAATEHIESHRDGGGWGGRRAAVIARSLERVKEGTDEGRLPEEGSLARAVRTLMLEHSGQPEDDDEVDPFAELGVVAGAASAGAAMGGAAATGEDLLAAFMDDEEEDPDDILESERQPYADEVDDESEEEQPEAEEEIEAEDEPQSEEIEPDQAYSMLLSTCWVDGILDPAEAKLLARKRQELGIEFSVHLELLREMLEREE